MSAPGRETTAEVLADDLRLVLTYFDHHDELPLMQAAQRLQAALDAVTPPARTLHQEVLEGLHDTPHP